MSDLRETIERLRALEAAATAGPWRSKPQIWEGEERWWCVENSDGDVLECECTPLARQDASLIAESRNALAALLDAAEKWERLKALPGSTTLEDAIESVERDMRKDGGNG